jgi:hypothetical protein
MENVLVNKPEKSETTFVQPQKNISDSNLFESKTELSTNQETPTMPEAFWVTREDKIEEKKDNGPSFDEQIDNLINSGGRSK